jgi:Uma2 family endonuclease
MRAPIDTGYAALIQAMPPGAVLTLQDVEWDEYEQLLREFDERPGIRLAYDHGRLEIMTLSPEHERIAALFPALILVLAEACGLNYLSLKSTTMRQRKKSRGLESDDCFYFRDFKRISGKKTLDLNVDPPPDLAIEVDVTSGSLGKFSIYASIGIAELWRYDRQGVQFFGLTEEQYTEIGHSRVFPFLIPDVVLRFLRKGEAEGTVPMVKGFRVWVRAHRIQRDRRRKQ